MQKPSAFRRIGSPRLQFLAHFRFLPEILVARHIVCKMKYKIRRLFIYSFLCVALSLVGGGRDTHVGRYPQFSLYYLYLSATSLKDEFNTNGYLAIKFPRVPRSFILSVNSSSRELHNNNIFKSSPAPSAAAAAFRFRNYKNSTNATATTRRAIRNQILLAVR